MLLLTDGTVMVQGNPMQTWWRLAPSPSGSYVDGTWSPRAPMSTARLYYASHVLPDGRVWVLGGEYSGPALQPNFTNTAEVYDPLTDSWRPAAPHPEPQFGDDPAILLGNGKILAGSIGSNQTYLYDYTSDVWSIAAAKVYPDRSDEESWVKMPNGKVLTYDIFQSISSGGQYAEIYDPVANAWSGASPSDGSARGSIPVLSTASLGYELGPLVRIQGPGMEGRVLTLGATGHTALYSPATNAWSAGPDIMGTFNGHSMLFGADDSPAAVLPNGHVLFAADAGPTRGTFQPPTQVFDYDPVANSIAPVSPSIPDPALAGAPAFVTRMLVLPTGQVLFSDGSRLWVYTPDGGPAAQTRPVFANVTYNGQGSFRVLGVSMNGTSAGSSYGDDVQSDQNYPIVRLTGSTGRVVYARTSNWTSTDVAKGVTAEYVDFTVPSGTPPDNYSLEVVGAGVASRPRCVGITAAQIAGTASASTAALACSGRQ